MPGRPSQVAVTAAVLLASVALSFYGCQSSHVQRSTRAGLRRFECTQAGDRSRYTVIASTHDTKGEYLKVQEYIRPGVPGFSPGRSGSPPLHIHNSQEECFTVNSGSFSYVVDGMEGHLKHGDKPACIPAGKPHQFWNGDNTTVLDMEFTLTPAGTFEQFIRTFCGLASDAGTVDNVSPLQMLVLFPHGDMQLADMPKPVWLLIEHIVVPVLQSLHIYKPVYPEYADNTYT